MTTQTFRRILVKRAGYPPSPVQIIDGKRRGAWVADALQAIISSTSPARRFFILREGFDVFQQRARVAYKAGGNVDYSPNELRWIYDGLALYVLVNRFPWQGGIVRERDMQREFERMYQAQRRKNLTPASTDNPDDGAVDVTTERVHRGLLERDRATVARMKKKKR